ncbi:NUDIX domain-containing protein [Lentzea sp. CA-135723]|uniref:NUDIX domain-containing protein n=1 Tax=Lentzea sp. CA-135723 TaxID=3239950 RepID=UPI003D8CF26C
MIENAHLTVDIVVLAPDADTQRWHVLLIERGDEPYKGRRALPGGDVDPHELPAAAALRELVEETGLDIAQDEPLIEIGTFSEPGRDPRGRVVSIAHLAVLPGMKTVTAGDDATAAEWVPVPAALDSQLAFDHHLILRAALAAADYPPFL